MLLIASEENFNFNKLSAFYFLPVVVLLLVVLVKFGPILSATEALSSLSEVPFGWEDRLRGHFEATEHRLSLGQ